MTRIELVEKLAAINEMILDMHRRMIVTHSNVRLFRSIGHSGLQKEMALYFIQRAAKKRLENYFNKTVQQYQ